MRIDTTGDTAIIAPPIGNHFRFIGRIFTTTGFTGIESPGYSASELNLSQNQFWKIISLLKAVIDVPTNAAVGSTIHGSVGLRVSY